MTRVTPPPPPPAYKPALTHSGTEALRDDAIAQQFLRGHDVPCPGCGYNRRDGAGSACPECGSPLNLTPTPDKPHGHLRTTSLAVYAFATLHGVLGIGWAIYFYVNTWNIGGGMFPTGYLVRAIADGALSSAIVITSVVLAIRLLRRVRRTSAAGPVVVLSLLVFQMFLGSIISGIAILF